MNPDKYIKKYPEGKIVKCVNHPLDRNQNPTPEQLEVYKKNMKLAKKLYDSISVSIPASPDKINSLANLEASMMYMNKANFHYKEVE